MTTKESMLYTLIINWISNNHSHIIHDKIRKYAEENNFDEDKIIKLKERAYHAQKELQWYEFIRQSHPEYFMRYSE